MSSLCFLLLNIWPTQSCPYAAPHLCVQQRTQEDHSCAHPVPGGERVLKVNDGEDEAEELSQGHHQGNGQRGALCGQNENPTDANIPEETVKVCNSSTKTGLFLFLKLCHLNKLMFSSSPQ